MNTSIGIEEFKDIFRLKNLWLFWGWLDIRQKYRRSVLGPIWVTMTMAVSVLVMGLVYSYLFKQPIGSYLPYVTAGFIIWSLISGFICESCFAFILNDGYINQIKLPILIYPLRLLWRYLIMFLHHVVVLLIVCLLFLKLSIITLLAACFGLILLTVTLFVMGVTLAFISTKLRDIPNLVATIFQVMFLVTPVIWPAEALGKRIFIAEFNPFYHMLQVVRLPLLNGIGPQWGHHVLIVLILMGLGLGTSFSLTCRWKRKLAYWL